MELDSKLLEKIQLLDDESLRSAIAGVAAGMGLDAGLTAMYLSDMDQVKKTVAGLTPDDLAKIQNAIGEENARNLAEHIRREVKVN